MKILYFLLFFLQIVNASIIIGKTDRVDFPKLNLEDIKVKIDTGAKTSALHCSYIKVRENNIVEFKVLNSNKSFFYPITRVAKIKSSNGFVEKRYIIKTEIVLFNNIYHTEFSLTNRKSMKYPVLLGRSFLKENFLVDVNKEDLSFLEKEKINF